MTKNRFGHPGGGMHDPEGVHWLYHEGGEPERSAIDRTIVDSGGHVASMCWAYGHVHEFSSSALSLMEARGYHPVAGNFPGTRGGTSLAMVKRLMAGES